MISLSRPSLGQDEIQAAGRVIASGQLAQGPEVAKFESEFAQYHAVAHGIAVASGTAALHLGLWAMGIGRGDEVIVPSFTFAATVNAVRMVGAKPVFADIDPHSFCVSRETVEPLVNARTAALIQVHLFGQPSAVDELVDLCARHGLVLVEDAAQAHGAEWHGKPVGGFGAFGAFSFYPTKNMTTGEGGMITTDDPTLAARIRMLRNHGMSAPYVHQEVGTNARMTEVAAAIGRIQLGKLLGWNRRRQANARFLDGRLEGFVETPKVSASASHVYHQYTIRSSSRREITDSLRNAQVGFGIYYDPPCHRQQAFEDSPADLPHTRRASREVVSIPVRPGLDRVQLGSVADAVLRGLSK